ncbi:MAG: oligosaccharide flippase family protein [Clostridiaceae bacterium]
MGNNKSILKNVFYKVMLNVFNIIIPIIIGPYVYRIMGPGLIGRISYAESIYTFFLIFASFGIYSYGIREISRVRDDEEKVSKLFSSLFTISTIANLTVVIIYLIFIFTAYRGTELFPILLIYTINLLLYIFYVEWLCEAHENYNFIAIKTMVIRLIYIVLLFAFVRTPKDLLIYVSLNTLLFLINYLVSFVYVKRRVKFNFKNLEIARHIKPLLFIIVMSNACILYGQLDKLMLGIFTNETLVGYYSTSQLITSIINALLLSIIYVTIPRLSHIIANETDEAYEALLCKIAKNYFAFLFPCAVGMFALANEIILLYGGIKFFPAAGVLKIFAFFLVLSGIEFIYTNQIFYVKRAERKAVVLIVCGGILNVALKFILGFSGMLNPYTAIITTTLAYGLLVTAEYTFTRRVLNVNFHIFKLDNTKYLFVSLFFIPIIFIIKLVVHGTIIISLTSVFACAAFYAATLFLIKDSVMMELLYRLKILKQK